MLTRFCAMLVVLGINTPLGAQALPVLPGWQELEAAFALDSGVAEVKRQLSQIAAQNARVDLMISGLSRAGWTCRVDHHDPDIERCLVDRYSFADGAADDIRWTLLLHAGSEPVSLISVDRVVDRHGSN